MAIKISPWMAIYHTFETLKRFKVWIPLFVYLIFKILLVLFYVESFKGPFASVWNVFLQADLRESLPHYPWNLMLMQVVLSRLDIILEVLLQTIFQGATVILFFHVYKDDALSLSGSFRETASKYLLLVGVGIVSSATLLLAMRLPALINKMSPGTLTGMAEMLTLIGVGLVIQTLFIFTMPFVLLGGESIFGAVKGSISLAGRSFGKTFIIVLLPFILTIPTLFLGTKTQSLVTRLSPEILIHIQITQEVTQWLSTLLLIGGLTVLFNYRKT